jgi:NitT/TauT family transport system substrate-binding protein
VLLKQGSRHIERAFTCIDQRQHRCEGGIAAIAGRGAGEIEQLGIVGVNDTDPGLAILLAAGTKCRELHWRLPLACSSIKYMIKKNIDKQEAIAKIASRSKNARVRETTMTRWTVAALLATLAVTGTAHAQTKLQIGCTATTDCASAMVAVDEGIFKKHGLDAEMIPIGINSNIPAAILSGSIQIGGPTSTVFLQAADGGLDLVAVAGATVMSPTSNANITAFVRNGITIKEPKDFIGKKVGAPGLGAFLHVLFVKWLVDKGVDPKKVNFVEVTFPTMPDIIKSGGVDAVLTAEPTVSRMLAAGSGSIGARYASELERTEPIIFYAASREWAEKNPDAVRKFRAAIAEGAAIVNSDKDKTSAAIAKFTKQTIELVKASPPNKSEPVLKPEQLAWWIDVMSSQKMLETKLDLNKLILK